MADEADEKSSNDFGKNIIPAMLAPAKRWPLTAFQGYWKDVGTIDSCGTPTWICSPRGQRHRPYDTEWPIYARTPIRPPLHGTGRQGGPLHGHRRL